MRPIGWAMLLVLGLAACTNLRIEVPRGLLGDRECGTCGDSGRYGP